MDKQKAPREGECAVVKVIIREDQYSAAAGVALALDAYDAECRRVFGGLPDHRGRAGAELMALIRAAEELRWALSPGSAPSAGLPVAREERSTHLSQHAPTGRDE